MNFFFISIWRNYDLQHKEENNVPVDIDRRRRSTRDGSSSSVTSISKVNNTQNSGVVLIDFSFKFNFIRFLLQSICYVILNIERHLYEIQKERHRL